MATQAEFDEWANRNDGTRFVANIAQGKDTGGMLGGIGSAISSLWAKPETPQIGMNPYMSQWNTLISQLQQQADGKGPSLAGNAYREAQATGMNNVLAMSRGGSAGQARAGMQTIDKMNQGFNAGYSNARLQEQMAARQSLQAALAGAGNAWFQPQQANLQASMANQGGGFGAFVQQMAPIAATIFGGPAAGAAMYAATKKK